MNIKYNKKNFNVDKFLNEYKILLDKYLKNFDIYELREEEILKFNEELKEENIIERNLYLPISNIIYDDMTIINGDVVDLNEGLEAEYVEGLTYMPTSGRLIEIGDFNVSIYSVGGVMITHDADGITLTLMEGKIDRSYRLKEIRRIENGGILSIEFKKLLKKFER